MPRICLARHFPRAAPLCDVLNAAARHPVLSYAGCRQARQVRCAHADAAQWLPGSPSTFWFMLVLALIAFCCLLQFLLTGHMYAARAACWRFIAIPSVAALRCDAR